jgi:hypothetical protein
MSESERRTADPRAGVRVGRRRGDLHRVRHPASWVLIGLTLALLVGLLGVWALTQTRWGREQVLAYTLVTLGGRLNGVLTIERLEGNVITGARLHGIILRDHDGDLLAAIDSAFIQYRVATLLGGDIVITRLEAFTADVSIFRMPGDTIWNYQEIFRDPTPDPDAEAQAILIERLRLHDTRVSIRAPLEPGPRMSPERWEAELREILADDRWMVEPVPGGYVRTTLLDVPQGLITELFIGADIRGGTYLQLEEGVVDVRLWRDPPLEVRDIRGRLNLQDGIVNFEAPRVLLPASSGELVGRIDLRGERPLYDVVITTPRFSLADLRWLYPWLPEDPDEGVGSGRLWVEDRPDGLLVLGRDLDLRMPGTHITGRFGLIADDGLRFVDVDLEADPLRVESVEQLFPADLPVEGLTIGGATIRGAS